MSAAASGGPKVLVFGMDGATWDVLAPLVAAGRVPAIARVIAEGASGPLASTIHPHSPTAWSSFLTGLDPGGHGIFDFVKRRAGSYESEVVSTRTRGGRALWQILSERGVRCGVVNVPMTSPPEKVAGFFVSGGFGPSRGGRTWPRALEGEIERVLGHRYAADAHLSDFTDRVDGGGDSDGALLDRFLERLLAVERERAEATLHLVSRFTPQLLVHVVTATDRAQHVFWRERETGGAFGDAIAETYVEADRQLARLVEAMGPDTTIVVLSDHGAGPLERVFFVNAWLEREGYLVRARSTRRTGAARAAYAAGKRFLPRGVRAAARARFATARLKAMSLLGEPIDWQRTRAFAEGTFGNVALNVAGREPRGVVGAGAEYESLRREICGKLEALVDPAAGTRPVERAWLREDLYAGPRVPEAPDVVVSLARGWQMVGDILAWTHDLGETAPGTVFAAARDNRFRISGNHVRDGILIASGPFVERGARVEGARITDLAPTILATLKQPIPSGLDGRVLERIAGSAEASVPTS